MIRRILTIFAIVSIIVFGLISCSRDYHLEYAGHYHPNTNVNHSEAVNPSTSGSGEQMSQLPTDESFIGSNNEQSPTEVKPIIAAHPSANFTFTPQQQKKADKILNLMEKKAAKNNIELNAPVVQSQTNKHSTTAISERHADDDALLYCLLAIFLPPLAVALWEDDITTNFWLDCLFTLIFWIPGIIFAWIVILGKS